METAAARLRFFSRRRSFNLILEILVMETNYYADTDSFGDVGFNLILEILVMETATPTVPTAAPADRRLPASLPECLPECLPGT